MQPLNQLLNYNNHYNYEKHSMCYIFRESNGTVGNMVLIR